MTLSAFGMNLHAATTADGRDCKQLERICRYLLRPPFAHDAVTALPGGRVRVSFKEPWRSGTAHADMDAHGLPDPTFGNRVVFPDGGKTSFNFHLGEQPLSASAFAQVLSLVIDGQGRIVVGGLPNAATFRRLVRTT